MTIFLRSFQGHPGSPNGRISILWWIYMTLGMWEYEIMTTLKVITRSSGSSKGQMSKVCLHRCTGWFKKVYPFWTAIFIHLQVIVGVAKRPYLHFAKLAGGAFLCCSHP